MIAGCGCSCHTMPGVRHVVACCAAPNFEQAQRIEEARDAQPTIEQFFKWADRSKAVTWAGKLGLKERWLSRDNPEYQQMLKDRKEKPNAV